MSAPAVFRFRCGHVGRTNHAPRTKHQVFIRVAELRGAKALSAVKDCPDCARAWLRPV